MKITNSISLIIPIEIRNIGAGQTQFPGYTKGGIGYLGEVTIPY